MLHMNVINKYPIYCSVSSIYFCSMQRITGWCISITKYMMHGPTCRTHCLPYSHVLKLSTSSYEAMSEVSPVNAVFLFSYIKYLYKDVMVSPALQRYKKKTWG